MRLSSGDVEYYRQRAAAERELAKASHRANVAEIHEELARLYDALVEQESLRPTLRIPAFTRSASTPQQDASARQKKRPVPLRQTNRFHCIFPERRDRCDIKMRYRNDPTEFGFPKARSARQGTSMINAATVPKAIS